MRELPASVPRDKVKEALLGTGEGARRRGRVCRGEHREAVQGGGVCWRKRSGTLGCGELSSDCFSTAAPLSFRLDIPSSLSAEARPLPPRLAAMAWRPRRRRRASRWGLGSGPQGRRSLSWPSLV